MKFEILEAATTGEGPGIMYDTIASTAELQVRIENGCHELTSQGHAEAIERFKAFCSGDGDVARDVAERHLFNDIFMRCVCIVE